MKDFSPQFSNPTQELLDAMQEKIYSLERRLNATGRDREGAVELLRVERYDIWGQNRATTASPLVPEYMFCREDKVSYIDRKPQIRVYYP